MSRLVHGLGPGSPLNRGAATIIILRSVSILPLPPTTLSVHIVIIGFILTRPAYSLLLAGLVVVILLVLHLEVPFSNRHVLRLFLLLIVIVTVIVVVFCLPFIVSIGSGSEHL